MIPNFEEGFPTENEVSSKLRAMGSSMNTAASAAVVNRTHRVVRQRAKTIREQKSRIRSLWIPLTVSFGMLALILCEAWNLLDESEFLTDGLPNATQQLLVLSIWCLPLSAIVLAVVWFRRPQTRNEGSL
jgi:hypothetical protein